MNDVLPKPFTKEGLLSMLEKHLSHLKKHSGGIDPMAAPPAPVVRPNRSLKGEDSPATSPATTSNWNSPNPMSGISPASNQADDAHFYGTPGPYTPHPAHSVIQPAPIYNAAGPMAAPPRQLPPHRRNISDISGGPAEMGPDVKRQQMYAPAPTIGPPMPRPPPPPR